MTSFKHMRWQDRDADEKREAVTALMMAHGENISNTDLASLLGTTPSAIHSIKKRFGLAQNRVGSPRKHHRKQRPESNWRVPSRDPIGFADRERQPGNYTVPLPSSDWRPLDDEDIV